MQTGDRMRMYVGAQYRTLLTSDTGFFSPNDKANVMRKTGLQYDGLCAHDAARRMQLMWRPCNEVRVLTADAKEWARIAACMKPGHVASTWTV